MLTACTNQKSKYEEVILEVGNIQITRYEFEKNYHRAFSVSPEENNQSFTETDQKKWINDFIDNTYFLADAYQKGYLTDERVNDDVNHMAKYILIQPYGSYEEETLFGDIKITEEEILREFENKTKYLVSFFVFKSFNEMDKYFSGRIPENKEQFDNVSVIAKQRKLRNNIFFEDSLFCPCQLKEESVALDTLQENQVTEPLITPNGVYIFLIKKRGGITQKYDETEKKKIKGYLAMEKKVIVRKKYMDQLIKDLAIQIDTNLRNEIITRLQTDRDYLHNRYIVNKAMFSDIVDKELFEYTDEKKRKSITIDKFIEYVNGCIIHFPLTDQKNVNAYIENFPVEEIHYRKALALGMDKDIQYQADKKNYMNSVIYYFYEKDLFLDGIKITDQELIDCYNKNKDHYQYTDEQTISSFYFKTIQEARKASDIIKHLSKKNLKNGLENMTKNHGLVDYKINEKINSISNNNILKITERFEDLNENECSRPIPANNMFLIVKKEIEHGSRQASFLEVKPDVRNMLFQQKLEEMKSNRLSELKQKLHITNNI